MRARSPRRYPVEVQGTNYLSHGRVYPTMPGSESNQGARTVAERLSARSGQDRQTHAGGKKAVRWERDRVPLNLSQEAETRAWRQAHWNPPHSVSRTAPWIPQALAPEDVHYLVVRELRERLSCFFKLYSPANLGDIDTIIQAFIASGSDQNAVEELNRGFLRTYGRDLNFALPSQDRVVAEMDAPDFNILPSLAPVQPMFDVVSHASQARFPAQFPFHHQHPAVNEHPQPRIRMPRDESHDLEESIGWYQSGTEGHPPVALVRERTQSHSAQEIANRSFSAGERSAQWPWEQPTIWPHHSWAATAPAMPASMQLHSPPTLPLCPRKDRFQPFHVGSFPHTVVALVGFVPRHAEELAFRADDVMTVTGQCIDGWLLASKHGREGLVPAAYVRFTAGQTLVHYNSSA